MVWDELKVFPAVSKMELLEIVMVNDSVPFAKPLKGISSL